MKSVILNKEKLTGFNVNATAPVGAIIMWASDNLPVGWLKCDHTELLIADYPKLYDRLKDIPQCQSENEGYFYTPDFRDREPQGANGNIGELIEAGLPNITGTITGTQGHEPTFSGAFSDSENYEQSGWNGNTPGLHNVVFDASKSNEIYGNSDTVQPPAFAIHFIIKATQTSDSLDEIIDDSKTDIGHTWSGKKIAEEIENSKTYSTEEKVVGTWIDGKPIYRKCINISNVASDYEHDVSSLNIDILCDIGGSFKDSSYKVVVGNYYVSGYRNIGCYYVNSSKKLRFQIQDLSSTNSVVLILEYTKTTD